MESAWRHVAKFLFSTAMAADTAGKARVQTQKRAPNGSKVVKKVTPIAATNVQKPSKEGRREIRGVKRIVAPVKSAKPQAAKSGVRPGVKRVIKLGDDKPTASSGSVTKDPKTKVVKVKAQTTKEPKLENAAKTAKTAKTNKATKEPKATKTNNAKEAKGLVKESKAKATGTNKKRASEQVAPKTIKKAKVPTDNDNMELLAGFSDNGSEDEDEEDDALASRAGPSAEEVVRLPSSRDDAVVRQRLERAQAKHDANPGSEKGVVYVGRLPRGFEEKQLRAYFSQFGDVERLRVSRNKKTGRSKHYAFIEFSSREVAEIVVDTMNNYLIDGHLLQMAMIPTEKIDPNMWLGAERKFHRVPVDRIERVRRTRKRDQSDRDAVNHKLLARQDARRERLARLGIDYDFQGYQT